MSNYLQIDRYNGEEGVTSETTEEKVTTQKDILGGRGGNFFDRFKSKDDVKKGEILLEVKNLQQHFKTGKYINKAVDGISLDVKRGEVFGIVGESGCGKTTAGRSIIKLYDATGGDVYLKSNRIVAGVGTYKQAIKDAKKPPELVGQIKANEDKIKQLRHELKTVEQTDSKKILEQLETLKQENAAVKAIIKNISPERLEIIAKNKKLIKEANYDHKNCDKVFQSSQVKKVEEEFKPLLKKARPEEFAAIKQQYKEALRVAKKEKLVTSIQMIFQDPIASLNPRMTVFDIIAEGLRIKGIRNKKILEQYVFEALDLVGLVSDHANRYPHEFSGGQKQRIGIARALVMNSDVLIADEPVSALDVSIQAQVINLLNELREKIGLTIIFIAHNLSVVKYFSDRIAVMYYGSIVELASSKDLFENPLHPYTRSLLSAIPSPDPLSEKFRKRVGYNRLAVHDYKVNKPSLVEVMPNHWVHCNEPELEEIRKNLGI